MLSDYKPRVYDRLLKRKLEGKGAVLLEGPKWCGKTTTAEQVARSIMYMSDPFRMNQNIQLANLNPSLLLQGEKPRLIDEWQLTPKLWDAIRFEVDHAKALGQYILTGSSVPAKMDEVMHTGTGRFAWLRMRTMSLFESGESNGQVSLGQLFESPEQIEGLSSIDITQLAYLTCRGGWPQATCITGDIALDQAFDYVNAVAERDITEVDGVMRDANRVRLLLRSLARHQGTQAPITTLCQDMKTNDSSTLVENTVFSYIQALKKIFVIEDVEAWNPNLRSKTALRTSDTRYFTDPSIATAAMGWGPQDLIEDLNTFGLIFESLCIRDLRIYADALDGKVYHYRDKNGLECDAVIHRRNGTYGLVEIKLGGDMAIEEGAKTLQTLESKIDTAKMHGPAFKMVLTGVGAYAYRREDGVYVVPIGCLRE